MNEAPVQVNTVRAAGVAMADDPSPTARRPNHFAAILIVARGVHAASTSVAADSPETFENGSILRLLKRPEGRAPGQNENCRPFRLLPATGIGVSL